ncbi:MAG TPA: hypothetical protein VFH78_06835 [Candidatus Thermoplasmatota archaeon]|nr:hypothetical protein [Candidatus Thermoplasmatota archaeon]
MRQAVLFASFLALALLAAPAILPVAEADHTGVRVVMPYGQSERYVPVVAGYEVVPRPLGCDAGTVIPTTILFQEDFEGPAPKVAISKSLVSSFPDSASSYQNLWHVTHHVANEIGTDDGHSGTGKLYFGNSLTGKMRTGGSRIAGVASFPEFTVPLEPTFLSWKDKFEVEGLFGYDHMWVELKSLTNGRVYILCSTDTDVRPDKSSHDNAFSTCSPYRTMLCPTGVRGDGGLHCPGAQLVGGPCLPYDPDFGSLGLHRIDPTAPHWENRYVRIPTELVGHRVVARFTFDSSDGVANGYMGWMGDDVMIAIGAPSPEPYAYVAPVPSP